MIPLTEETFQTENRLDYEDGSRRECNVVVAFTYTKHESFDSHESPLDLLHDHLHCLYHFRYRVSQSVERLFYQVDHALYSLLQLLLRACVTTLVTARNNIALEMCKKTDSLDCPSFQLTCPQTKDSESTLVLCRVFFPGPVSVRIKA